MKTHTLATTEADIVYDVRGPLPTADGRPALFGAAGNRAKAHAVYTRLQHVLKAELMTVARHETRRVFESVAGSEAR
jgi:hypothetical protein